MLDEVTQAKPDPEYGLLLLLIEPKMAQHPRPWRIEYDWTVAVLDADGVCVLECHNTQEAEMLIGLAGDADDYCFREMFEKEYA
jgi:hypothetical protein